MESAQGQAISKDELPDGMFMCSELYIAAFEGRTEEVLIGLQTGGVHTATAARNGRPRPSPGDARPTGTQHGPCCTTREVTADRSTLLHIAAGQGHRDLVTELGLRDGALLFSANSSLDTPLHCAARSGHAGAIEAIVRLARRDADADRLREELLGRRNRAGDTALHVAARHGHGEAGEALMKLAPELAAGVNGAAVSPLYLAVMSRSVRAVEAILGYRDASAAGPMSQNALHAAVLQSSEMVSLLLRWQPGLATDLDCYKSSPLHFASSDGDCDIIKEILTYAPPSTAYLQDREGLSALHAAALMGNGPAVKLLLQFCPASADIRDNQGRSFLHVAALRGHSSIVSHVIKNRMLENLLNVQDLEGNTALHLAVQAGEYRVVSKLLSSGKVQVHIMNNEGCTPSDLIENSTSFYSMVRLVVKLNVYQAQFRPQRQDHVKEWAGQDLVKWRLVTSKNLAIVSTLVATVAFSAAFNVPGSYGSDGKATLNGNRMYNAFLVLDTIAVTTAVVATILLVYGRASRSHHSWLDFIISMHFLWLSLLSMMLGFFTAIAATSDKNSTLIALVRLIYSGLYVLVLLLTILGSPGSLRGVLRLLFGRKQHLKRRINRQYPFVVIYAFNMLLFIVISNIAISAVDTIGNVSTSSRNHV
ncbi:protein ACCELERATED CELL DEATH 6-like [Miscanthus floridulus]|uniref:protein ACCELERATED CELL DEATH 6-like n=1 Tax=Miscanthus floridulus TaxID=154761 RepID=UPI003458081A